MPPYGFFLPSKPAIRLNGIYFGTGTIYLSHQREREGEREREREREPRKWDSRMKEMTGNAGNAPRDDQKRIFEQSGRQSEALLARSYCRGTGYGAGRPDDVSARKTGPGHARSLGSCRRDRVCERSRSPRLRNEPPYLQL